MKPNLHHILVIALMSLIALDALAHDFEIANSDGVTIYYKKTNDGEVAVSCRGLHYYDYNEYSGNVAIPASIVFDGVHYNVTSIAMDAFNRCSDLTSVTIPNGIKSIGKLSFCYCSSLQSLHIPSSVTNISSDAFAGCSSLESISVDRSNPVYDSRDNCNAIVETSTNTMITACVNTVIPKSVTQLGDDAYWGCKKLTSMIIPPNITTIGYSTFSNCTNLKSIFIPKEVTNMGSSFIGYCSGITSIKVEWEEPITLGYGVFSSFASNATLYVPLGSKAAYEAADQWKDFKEIKEYSPSICFADANVKAICVANWDTNGDGELGEDEAAAVTDLGTVFQGKTSITSFDELQYFIHLDGVTNFAFENCTSLTSVVIPDGATWWIGSKAFSGCSNLSSISIPNSITNIGAYAFLDTEWYSNQPDGLVYAGKMAYDYKGSYPADGHIIIKEGTVGIANAAFSGAKWSDSGSNTSITAVTIPASVTSIGNAAFYRCAALLAVTLLGQTPVYITSDTFSNSPNAVLIVPQGAKASYAAADNWKNFKVIVEASAGQKGDVDGDGVVDIADAVRIVNLVVGKIDALAPEMKVSLPEPE